MQNKNPFKVIFITTSVFIVMYIFFIFKFPNKALENYKAFNKADINGEIEFLDIARKGNFFRIKNCEIEFVFNPITSDLNSNYVFDDIAEVGDIIIKPRFSDTLKLIKKNKVYFCTFQKIEVKSNN